MVQIYRQKWERGFFESLFGCIRDFLILALPIKKIPSFLVRRLYGMEGQFAFLVHPRAYQDIFISSPFLKPVKLLIRKKNAFNLISRMPPFVLNTVCTRQNINGFVIAQLTVPEIMFEEKKAILDRLKQALRLVSKITSGNTAVGLGGWFPIISRRGVSLEEYAKSLGMHITSGHCGTLASIFMMVEKIAEAGGLNIHDLNLAILGVGKMGGSVAKAFHGKVNKLFLIDVSDSNLVKVRKQLLQDIQKTKIESVVSSSDNMGAVRQALKESHIGICATATFRNLLKVRDMPIGFIAIDDSRPEALPRDPKNERIILEGGLLKIRGAKINYNYGFGLDDNVFGCLGEAFLLALNEFKELDPTVGDVDMENLFRLLKICKDNEVTVGDLKSSDYLISDDDIRNAISKRRFLQDNDLVNEPTAH